MTDLCKFQQYDCTMGDGTDVGKNECIFQAYCDRIRELEEQVAELKTDAFIANDNKVGLDTFIKNATESWGRND